MRPIRLDDIEGWLRSEVAELFVESHRRIVTEVDEHLDDFVKWPDQAELLWAGCDRGSKYHVYPAALKALFRERGLTADGRSNGPAVMAYLVAGGVRPRRSGANDWNVHHLYDGKFPYNREVAGTLHAVKRPMHFTQSAGLVAIHPIADALAHECRAFAWRLRAESFHRFGYDPDGVFSASQDEYGFAGPRCARVWHDSRADRRSTALAP